MAIGEWDQRQLCSDGACIGVIGPDGTCKTCGRVAPDWGDERRRGLVADAGGEEDGEEEDGDGDEEDSDEGAEGEAGAEGARAPAVAGVGGAWNQRRLCENGACIGVIGADGRCKVCGTAASGEAAADAGDEGQGEGEYEDDDGDEGDDDEYEDDDSDEAAASAGDGDDGDDDDDADDDAAATDGDAAGRKLCPDGACIGVIGADNRCKVCGKEAA